MTRIRQSTLDDATVLAHLAEHIFRETFTTTEGAPIDPKAFVFFRGTGC